ncbi:MAG: hypothetical protein IPM71_05360 [Bacteroidota bacterium]|nr:MAG: hypothetical protein IPM71_05360 [Bacteroidota bacterium]
MRKLLILLFLGLTVFAYGQNNNPSKEEIRQKMAKIRQTTNWDDPVAAKKANEEIKELAAQLMAANNSQANPQNNSGQEEGTDNKDAQKLNELNQEMVDQKMDVYAQIWKAAAGGKGADILLAEPLREEIVEEYKADDDKTVKNAAYLEQMTTLVIDLSMPGVQAVIDQMPNFLGIKVLVITAGEHPVPVNISAILKNASGYPLETLYIINFGVFVRDIPPEVTGFKRLSVLGLFNNNISALPVDLANLKTLKELYIDVNPLSTVFPCAESFSSIEKLGIAKTNIPDSEITTLENKFPGCQILTE